MQKSWQHANSQITRIDFSYNWLNLYFPLPDNGGETLTVTKKGDQPMQASAPLQAQAPPSQERAKKPVQVVYIAGYGRSGSTLLDTMLGNHAGAFGAGELTGLFESPKEGTLCSCGQAVVECDFWRSAFERIFNRFPSLDMESASALTRRNEALLGTSKSRDAYRDLWETVFETLSTLSGRRTVIDSSKTSRLSYHRLALLAQGSGALQIKVIHLTRDPRAVMWSSLRGSNRRLEAGSAKSGLTGMYRGLAGWLFANTAFERTHRRCSLDVLRFRYEDLINRPEEAFQVVGDFIGLELAPVLEKVRGQEELAAGHAAGGNRMRRESRIIFKPDLEWRENLPRLGHISSLAAWPWMRRYGYRGVSCPEGRQRHS